VLKLALMGGTIAWIIVDATDNTMRLMYAPPIEGVNAGARLLLKLFIGIGVLYVAHAAIDYGHQYYEYMKKMRMSKDEVKREYRDSEGNPEIKSERRRLAQELLFSPPGEATKKATVLVVNPTHFAVAIFYEPGVTDLPMVVEKAVDDQALFLRGVARDAGVPVFEYPLLARQLFSTVQTFKYVPKDLFPAVAEVLQWVRKVKPA
jgi:type III secretion protein U